MPAFSLSRITLPFLFLLITSAAHAQTTTRDRGWDDATTGIAVASGATALLMPRFFYSNPEATVGWKARWHVSALAPVMTHAAITWLNEGALKQAFAAPRPGCGEAAPGTAGCETFGLFSSQVYSPSASLGHGISVFLVDTLGNSQGRFHFGSLVGHVIVPLALTSVNIGGRIGGNLEDAGQVFGTAGVGLLTGLAMGLLYSTMQDPACGYTGNLICW